GRRAPERALRRGHGAPGLDRARPGAEHSERSGVREVGRADGRRVSRIFLLSPAHCGGLRARMVLSERASFYLALRAPGGGSARLGEVFSFLSGLYFRGKLAYARAFANPSDGRSGVFVITPTDGLRPADEPIDLARLRRFATVDIDGDDPRYRGPLDRDV